MRCISLSTHRFPAPKQLKNHQDTRFVVIAEIERQASEAWGGGKAVVAYDFMRISVPAELNDEGYADVVELDVEEVLEIEVGEISRERGRGRARGAFRGAGRGGWRGQWRGRDRGRGDGGSRDGSGLGGSERHGKKRKFDESADTSSSLARR